MKRLVLRNVFHNTSCVVFGREGESAHDFWLRLQCYEGCLGKVEVRRATRRIRRIERVLCGLNGCRCGTVRM